MSTNFDKIHATEAKLWVFSAYFWNSPRTILLVNVPGGMAVTVVCYLLPCWKKLKNVDFTKRLKVTTKELYFCKIKSQLEAFLLNAFLRFEKPLMRGNKLTRNSIGTIYLFGVD